MLPIPCTHQKVPVLTYYGIEGNTKIYIQNFQISLAFCPAFPNLVEMFIGVLYTRACIHTYIV